MAKKRRGAQQHRWEREEEGILLAWLDHTIAHREVDFESTIVTRLNSVYTIAQINRKLAGLWKSYGPHHEERKPGIWVSDLNTYGSECLKRTNHMEYGLPEEVLKELTTWTMLFEEEYAAKQLLQPSRKLRSQSRSNDFSPARRTGLNSPKPPIQTSQTPRQRTQTCSLTPSAIKREIESPPGKKSPAKKTKYKPSQNIRSPNIAFAKSPNRTPRPQINTRHGRAGRHRKPSISVINDSEEELDNHLGRREAADDDNEIPTRCICGATEDIPPPVERENPYSPHEWILCSRCNIWQHIICVIYCFNDITLPENYFCERCEPEFHRNRQPNQSSSHITDSVSVNLRGSRSATAPIEEELNHLQSVDENIITSLAGETPSTMLPGQSTAREKISDLEEEIWQLKLELEVRDTTITGLEREVSCLKESQKQRDAQTGIPVEELMTENLKQERSLYANLRARQEGAKFAKLAATSREWFGHIKTDHGFYDIYSESRQILCQRDCENWEFTPSLVGHDKLQNLVSKCLSVELRTPEQMNEAMDILLRFTPDEVVRALATGALLLWVFETDFPQFDKESSEFLTKYRELLATQDGAIALRNIDLAARASLTRSMAFQAREIPETAKNLAIKLSQTLAPLFSQIPEAREEVDWDGFATWHDDIEEWTGRRKRFEDMFKAALRMKADSCLNTEDYEMVIYPPGTKFNQKTMETQAIAGKNSASTQVGRAIGLCIEAAVFSHARKELDQNATVSEATATSHNFLRREEKDRAQSLPIVKAVVVLVEK